MKRAFLIGKGGGCSANYWGAFNMWLLRNTPPLCMTTPSLPSFGASNVLREAPPGL